MKSPIIEIVISPQGETRVETKGFAGSSCRQASRFLEQALGTMAKETVTAEFYEQEAAQNHLQQGGAS
jgi:hypothetical protein